MESIEKLINEIGARKVTVKEEGPSPAYLEARKELDIFGHAIALLDALDTWITMGREIEPNSPPHRDIQALATDIRKFRKELVAEIEKSEAATEAATEDDE